jgi:large subunit ribosomal protein L2
MTIKNIAIGNIKKHKLTFPLKKASGINIKGRNVARFRGKKSKNINYSIDYKRTDLDCAGLVLSIFKTIGKSTFIALIKYYNGAFSYVPATYGMYIGQLTNSFTSFNYNRNMKKFLLPGTVILLRLVSRYSIFSNLQLLSMTRAKYARSAGTYCQLIEKFEDYQMAVIKLPTGVNKVIHLDAFICLGRNSNIMHKFTTFGKAGARRIRGSRPIVRGVARNPVDHPNGGRTKTNKPEKSLWGWVAKNNC